MNLEPAERMALALHLNPGRYAVLIGAGVSSAAGIPDGWSVILDLVSKLAALKGEVSPKDPEQWFVDTFQQRLMFGVVLDGLGLKETGRRNVLAPYIETPGSAEGDPEPSPSLAHREIARLAGRGLINLILTTNIDQLMERALAEASVEYDVASSDAEFDGVQTAFRTRCLLAKLHGDYKREGVRLTTAELESYPGPVRRFLRKMLPEFGIIFCGWSGKWDKALVDAIARTPCRKYESFWLTRAPDLLADEARRVIAACDATVVHIGDADQAFTDLSSATTALEESKVSHPESLVMALNQIRLFARTPEEYPRLRDILTTELETQREMIMAANAEWVGKELDKDSYASRVVGVSDAASRSVSIVGAVSAYGSEHTDQLLVSYISSLGSVAGSNSGDKYEDLQKLPALLVKYSIGITAVHERRFSLLRIALTTPEWWDSSQRRQVAALEILNPFAVFRGNNSKLLPADKNYHWWNRPSHFLGDMLYPQLSQYFADETTFRHELDIFEFVQSLVELDTQGQAKPIPGQFALWDDYFRKGDLGDNFTSPVGRFYHTNMRYPDCAFLQAGFFGGDFERMAAAEHAQRVNLADFVLVNSR